MFIYKSVTSSSTINHLCKAIAPSYYASGYDEDGEPQDIIENTGPYDAVDRTLKAALSTNPFVKETLEAWGVRVSQRRPNYPPSLLNKRGRFAKAKDIPEFGKREKKRDMKKKPTY